MKDKQVIKKWRTGWLPYLTQHSHTSSRLWNEKAKNWGKTAIEKTVPTVCYIKQWQQKRKIHLIMTFKRSLKESCTFKLAYQTIKWIYRKENEDRLKFSCINTIKPISVMSNQSRTNHTMNQKLLSMSIYVNIFSGKTNNKVYIVFLQTIRIQNPNVSNEQGNSYQRNNIQQKIH